MDEVLSVKNGKAVTRRNTLRSSVEAINQYLSTKKSKVRYDVAEGAYKVFGTTAEKTKYNFDKPMSENSQAAVENLLIDTFMASLLDSKNVHDTTRPLDVPVNIMKKDIVKKYFKDKVSDVALYEYTLEYQDNLKQDFADSKSGIGPFALNNPHHVLGQLVGLYMNMPEELSNLGNLHQVTGVDGIHILDWLSALISAHVDVAKDNYIIKLNVNSYTYNMTNFLIRSGMGKNSLMFVSQEIIKELANEYIQSKGVYGFDKGQPFYLRFRNKKEEIFERYVKKAMSLATKEQKVLLNTLIDPEFKVTDELLAEIPASGELTKLEQLLQTASENKKDFDYYFEQIRIFKLFEQITPYAEALSELVKASQVDTKKFGKNAIEMQNFLNKVDALYNSPFFDPELIEKFFNNTFLLRKIENSIKFSLGLLGNVNIQAKPEYFKLFQNFVHAAGLSSLSNERSINELSNAIDSTVRAIALTRLAIHPNDAKHLFVGDNTIAKRLNKLKKDILEDAINGGNKYPNITVTNGRISNLLLNSLTGITDFSKKGIDYLRFDYSDDIASNASRQIREYWQELLESDNDEVSDFAYDLIQYAVYTGFGTKHINSLFDFIPTSFLEGGYYDEIRRVERQTGAVTELFDHDTIDELYRNNWFNDLLVPTVKIGGKNAKMFSYVSQGKNKQIALINPKGRRLVTDERGVGLYAPYVKARVRNATCGYNLYKFVGTFQKTNKLGKIEETPLYILVNKKGYREGGKGFVTEYFNEGMYEGHTSLIPNNNVSLKFKDASGNLQYLEDLPDVLDKFINNLINKTGNLGVYRKADTIQYMFQLDGSNSSNSMKFNEIETDDGEIEDVKYYSDEYVKGDDSVDNSSTNANETVFTVASGNNYPQRTKDNANWSDITIALAVDFSTRGEQLTKAAAGNKYVNVALSKNPEKWDYVKLADNIKNQIQDKKLPTSNVKLNIAGNGIYSFESDTDQQRLNSIITQIIGELQAHGIHISAIRSGGQTGIDEAGIIAAQRLNIPNEVHTTSNYAFRVTKDTFDNVYKTQVSDKEYKQVGSNYDIINRPDLFKARFDDNQESQIPNFIQALLDLGPQEVISKNLSYLKDKDTKRTDYSKLVRKSKTRIALEQLLNLVDFMYPQDVIDLNAIIDSLDISEGLKNRIKEFRNKVVSNSDFVNPLKHLKIDEATARKLAEGNYRYVEEHTRLMSDVIKEVYNEAAVLELRKYDADGIYQPKIFEKSGELRTEQNDSFESFVLANSNVELLNELTKLGEQRKKECE